LASFFRSTVAAAPLVALAVAACGLDGAGLAAPGVDASAVDGAGGGPDVVSADGAGGGGGGGAPIDGSVEDAASEDDAPPCYDTYVDPHNCGTCGHDCRGAACAGGLCQPDTLASNLGSVDFVRLTATDLFFTTGGGGQVGTCPLGGCPGGNATILLSAFPHGFIGLALDASNFYTADTISGNMVTCPFTGCGVPPTQGAVGPGGSLGNGVFVFGGTVYWVDQANAANAGGSGAIWTANVNGTSPANIAPNLADPIDVLVDGANAYWTVSQAGHIDTCALSNCKVSQIAVSQKGPQYLATDGQLLYWTNDGSGNGTPDGSVVQSSFDGKTQVTIAGNLPSPRGLVVDSGYVYWANFVNHNSGSGTVMKCPVGAPCATPTVLAQGLRAPFGVATDALYVYWGDDGDGTIMRVAK
jgi:hypothetical protein